MEQTVNETRFLNLRGSKPEIDELIQQIVEQATLVRLDKSDLIYLYKEQVVYIYTRSRLCLNVE